MNNYSLLPLLDLLRSDSGTGNVLVLFLQPKFLINFQDSTEAKLLLTVMICWAKSYTLSEAKVNIYREVHYIFILIEALKSMEL